MQVEENHTIPHVCPDSILVFLFRFLYTHTQKKIYASAHSIDDRSSSVHQKIENGTGASCHCGCCCCCCRIVVSCSCVLLRLLPCGFHSVSRARKCRDTATEQSSAQLSRRRRVCRLSSGPPRARRLPPPGSAGRDDVVNRRPRPPIYHPPRQL